MPIGNARQLLNENGYQRNVHTRRLFQAADRGREIRRERGTVGIAVINNIFLADGGDRCEEGC